MVIDLSVLEEGETNWSGQSEPTEVDLSCLDYEFTDPVAVRLLISRREEQFIIRGHATTSARAKCVKCLKAFTLPVDAEIGWVVQVLADPKEAAQSEPTEDYWFIEKGEVRLEIAQRVREVILVSLPDHPVCREDCRGLCVGCGQDLNEGECTCGDKKIDSRWATLAEFARKKDNSSSAERGEKIK